MKAVAASIRRQPQLQIKSESLQLFRRELGDLALQESLQLPLVNKTDARRGADRLRGNSRMQSHAQWVENRMLHERPPFPTFLPSNRCKRHATDGSPSRKIVNMPTPDWVHREVAVDGTRWHYVEAGEGKPVLLLHGFPEFWCSWRHQIPALAAAGFRAIAPDLPGYHELNQPAGVRSYRVAGLVEQIAALIRRLADGPISVVGHDWGGVLAWRLAALNPELIGKLAILNAPHPAALHRELKRNPRQWLRSWYVLLFQLPWLPERILRAGDFGLLERAWRRQPVHPGAFSEEDIAQYKRVLGRPAGLIGPLNYYKAAMRYPLDLYGSPQTISVPTLLLWGEQDAALSPRLAEGLETWVSDLRVMRIPDASHWLQNDVPERVNQALIDYFGE